MFLRRKLSHNYHEILLLNKSPVVDICKKSLNKVNVIVMSTHNTFFYVELDKATDSNQKTQKLYDCAVIRECVVFRSNMVYISLDKSGY